MDKLHAKVSRRKKNIRNQPMLVTGFKKKAKIGPGGGNERGKVSEGEGNGKNQGQRSLRTWGGASGLR